MVFRIVIAGETQCDMFAEVCLVADYLQDSLPSFCYERIPKSIKDWKQWLCKVNIKNDWHHDSSPLVWKELLTKGSKPFYVGGAPEFLEYCHSYYNFDVFLSPKIFGSNLIKNFAQYKKKVREEVENVIKPKTKKVCVSIDEPEPVKTDLTLTIYGAAYALSMNLISELLGESIGGKFISKIYIYDDECSPDFMDSIERECSFVGSIMPGKVVKYVDKIGVALTNSDLLIILHHVPFQIDMSIGDWLYKNEMIMHDLAQMINACASRKMYILFANLGPACFNATILRNSVNTNKNNIVVVTSGLGLDTIPVVSKFVEIPMRTIFCPPVWGFVGINHIVDLKSTLHKYDSFEPYTRYTRVANSTLNIGSLTPEIRTLEYLLFNNDDMVWKQVAEIKSKIPNDQIHLPKAVALLKIVKLWLCPDPDAIVNLGVSCNGSFGLTFDGIFSQPCWFKDKRWQPAGDYMVPKDTNVKLPYLEYIAETVMNMKAGDLPNIVDWCPCVCKSRIYKRKGVW